MEQGGQLEEEDTFAIIGATIADNFQVKMQREQSDILFLIS